MGESACPRPHTVGKSSSNSRQVMWFKHCKERTGIPRLDKISNVTMRTALCKRRAVTPNLLIGRLWRAKDNPFPPTLTPKAQAVCVSRKSRKLEP